MARPKVREMAVPVGLFILLSVIILVGGILWIRHFMVQPAYSFIVQYKEPGRVSPGIPAFYRGVQVGRVSEVKLAPDLNSTYVVLAISNPDLIVSEQAEIFIRIEGITGQRFIEIAPPSDRGFPEQIITQGEIVHGVEPYNWDELQAQLHRIAEEGTLEKLVNTSYEAMAELSEAANEWETVGRQADSFLAQTAEPARQAILDFSETTRGIGLASNEAQAFFGAGRYQLKDAVPRIANAIEGLTEETEDVDATLAAIQNAASRIDGTFNTLEEQLTETNLIPNLSQAVVDLDAGIRGFTGAIGGINTQLTETDLIPTVSQTVRQVGAGVRELNEALGIEGTAPKEQIGMTEALNRLEQQQRELERPTVTPSIPKRPTVQPSPLASEVQALNRELKAFIAKLQTARSDTREEVLIRERPTIERLYHRTQEIEARLDRDIIQVKGNPNQVIALETTRDRLRPVTETLAVLLRLSTPAPVTRKAVVSPAAPDRPLPLLANLSALIQQSRLTMTRIDCVTAQLSDMLDERFLGFKLFFGKPGGGYQCETVGSTPYTTPRSIEPVP